MPCVSSRLASRRVSCAPHHRATRTILLSSNQSVLEQGASSGMAQGPKGVMTPLAARVVGEAEMEALGRVRPSASQRSTGRPRSARRSSAGLVALVTNPPSRAGRSRPSGQSHAPLPAVHRGPERRRGARRPSGRRTGSDGADPRCMWPAPTRSRPRPGTHDQRSAFLATDQHRQEPRAAAAAEHTRQDGDVPPARPVHRRVHAWSRCSSAWWGAPPQNRTR